MQQNKIYPKFFLSHLGNTMRIPEDDPDLGRGQTLLSQLEDLVLDILRGQLEPGGHGATVRKGRLGDSLARCVHTTHLEIGSKSVTSQDRARDHGLPG